MLPRNIPKLLNKRGWAIIIYGVITVLVKYPLEGKNPQKNSWKL